MRIAICALSAVLLSGCSWLGGINNVFGGQGKQAPHGVYGQHAGQYGQAGAVQYGQNARGPHGQAQQFGQNFGGGFPQQPQFGAPQQVTGQYGTHAANAHQARGSQHSKPQMRKPRLRGSMSLGLEKSNSGAFLDFSKANLGNPALGYNPDNFAEGFVTGSPASGSVESTVYSAIIEEVRAPEISFDDVHSTPLSISGGLEFIFSPKTTLFANAGYGYAEGESGAVATVIGELRRTVTQQDFDTVTGSPIGAPVTNISFVPNQEIATFDYNFSDLKRLDLEVGARHYFNPIMKDSANRTVSPFVAASVGASHSNEQTFTTSQRQVFFQRAFDSSFGAGNGQTADFYNVVNPGPSVTTTLYDSQWIPRGQLNAGLEWQATPRTAVAFETGVKFEGARDYAGVDEKGDTNVSIPFTIRGSYNF